MPSIKVTTWAYEKVQTTQATYVPEDPAAKKFSESYREIVTAVFELIDGEPFKKTSQSINAIRPRQLHVTFVSYNGEDWRVDRTHMIGANVLKSGEDGAVVEVHRYDFPEWVKDLVSKTEDRTAALDWIRDEYAR
jgi:hypothetical protein